jgi:hypothetical protein
MRRESLVLAVVIILVSGSAYAQCARMVGSNQIVCPSYGNSTVPVYTGPSGYRPGPGVVGIGQMGVGVGGAALNIRRGNSQGLQYNAASIANGYNTLRTQPLMRYQPRIAYPSARPQPNYRFR